MEFPQEPVKQSYILSYPILCYKTRRPDDKSIAIVHLADDIPQRIVHLGQWKFMTFVHSSFDSTNTSRQILFLCQNEDRKQRLFMIELDPWKRIDRKVNFDQPEAIINFDGDVAKAPISY